MTPAGGGVRGPRRAGVSDPGYSDEILEDVAGADAWELVDVADEEQVRARRHGLEQRGGEARVEHRGFVEHEEVGGERSGFVGDETAAGGIVFEQAVDRRREAAGRLGEPLGGAAGRRGQMHADFLGL